jgi:hypothetical protein
MKLPAIGTDFCQLQKQKVQSSRNSHALSTYVKTPSIESRYSTYCDQHGSSSHCAQRVASASTTAVYNWRIWDLCWAQCEGYPFWPGVVVDLQSDLVCIAWYEGIRDISEAQWFSRNENSIKSYASNRQLCGLFFALCSCETTIFRILLFTPRCMNPPLLHDATRFAAAVALAESDFAIPGAAKRRFACFGIPPVPARFVSSRIPESSGFVNKV